MPESALVRERHAAVTGPDGLIYVLGGFGVSSNTDTGKSVDVFDPANPSKGWVPTTPMTEPRLSLAVAVAGDNRIYAIGGSSTGSVEAFNVTTQSWAPVVKPMTKAERGLAAATGRDGRIYAIGGGDSTCRTSAPYSTVEIFGPKRPGSLIAGKPMHTARDFTVAAEGDGRIFAMGGGSH